MCAIYSDIVTESQFKKSTNRQNDVRLYYIRRVSRRFGENRLHLVYYIYATDRFKMNKLLRSCYIYKGIYVCDCILRACTYIKYNISRRQENIRLYILYDNNIIYYYIENVSRIIYPRRWYSRNKFQLPAVGIYSCRGKYRRRTTTGGT